MVHVENTPVTTKKKSSFALGLKRFKNQWQLQCMVIPALVFIFIFQYIPMYGVLIAFKDYNFFEGIMGSPWVGLKHFKAFFNEPQLGLLLKNTVGISVLKTLLGFPGPIIFALLLNELMSIRYKKVVQCISYLPHFVSLVVIVGMFTRFSSTNGGLFNDALMALNIIDEPISFLTEPKYFWGILVSLNCWKGIGWGSIIYCAAISGVDQALYEAATVDGAGRFGRALHVTLPGILPVVVVYLIFAMSGILTASGFEDIILLRNPMTLNVAETVSTYSYTMGISQGRYSFATAIGLFASVVNIILLFITNRISRKVTENSLW